MKPRKLKSGSWNLSVYIGKDADGKKRYRSVTKATRKECIIEANRISVKRGSVLRVAEAVERYIAAKKNVLSPNTYRSYLAMYNNHIKNDPFGIIPIEVLTDTQVQKWVSKLATESSPKTVKNIYSLFLASVKFEDVRLAYNVKLPQRKAVRLHTPTTAEVMKVMEMAKDNPPLYRAIVLGAVGMMRLGEICALTAEDIDRKRNTITISKAMALTADNDIVIKPPKTDASNRTIVLPKYVIDLLPKKGYIIGSTPNAISTAFRKLMKKADVVPFRFHDLRHYAASIAASSSVGASVESIKARGGWATDGMMKRIYINQIGDEVDKDTAAINAYYESKWG